VKLIGGNDRFLIEMIMLF
jgi:hypothetical protein